MTDGPFVGDTIAKPDIHPTGSVKVVSAGSLVDMNDESNKVLLAPTSKQYYGAGEKSKGE